METLAIDLQFRPIRIGWCVKTGDFEGFRKAVRYNHVLWGGRYNPIILYDQPQAELLVRLFRVDALLPISSEPGAKAFVQKFPYIPWPLFHEDLFVGNPGEGSRPQIVDIWHPIRRIIRELRAEGQGDASVGVDFVTWEENDPLSDVFLSVYGEFPSSAEVGTDYAEIVRQRLKPGEVHIGNGSNIPVLRRSAISNINQTFVERHYAIGNYSDFSGFYVGDAGNLEDLVTFWNLRAADIELQFYDPKFQARFESVRADWSTRVRDALTRAKDHFSHLTLWYRDGTRIGELQSFGPDIAVHSVTDDTWNGLNVKAPIMYFGSSRALATISNSDVRPQISFPIADRPFADDDYDQHYVLSVDPGIGLFGNERATLHLPYIPELNEYYGRNFYFQWNRVRVEPGRTGIITTADATDLTLSALNVTQLVAEIFRVVGIDATPSKSGLVGTSLIRQMGGIEGCRPFKIAGVRTLIESFRPDQSFDRACALQTIRGQETSWPIEKYKWLYIEPRKPGTDLKSGAVFSYLLEKGVFRAGLKFNCPSCMLDFWLSLDAAGSRVECEFCGNIFNAGPQLRDKGWAFRKSGLFGRDDHQEGAVAVILTLLQLARAGGSFNRLMYTTAMDLRPKGANIKPCETDFVVVGHRGPSEKIPIVIGECKTRQPISASDVENLKSVAELFPYDRYDVFVVFAKLVDFSDPELELIKAVQGKRRPRAILLTDRELEPYYPYERTKEEFEIDHIAVGFEKMAQITQQVFFEKKRRVKGENPG